MFNFTPQHDFLVGIDSDGCVFDTMELKHKECFIPNIINHWNLQGVSKYAREAAEFVNLYSKSRGINRFPALVETMEWLQKRPEVQRPRREGRNSAVAPRLDQTRDEARQSDFGKRGRGPRRSRSEADAGLVEGGEQVDRGDGPRRAAVSVRPREHDKASRAGRHPRGFGHAARSLAARMGGARSFAIRGGDLRAGDRHEEGIARRGGEVSGRPHADDRRRARRLSRRPWRTRPCSSPSIPARKKPVGNAFTRKASNDSSAARSPANIKKSCWPSSNATSPTDRRGRWWNNEYLKFGCLRPCSNIRTQAPKTYDH